MLAFKFVFVFVFVFALIPFSIHTLAGTSLLLLLLFRICSDFAAILQLFLSCVAAFVPTQTNREIGRLKQRLPGLFSSLYSTVIPGKVNDSEPGES